MINGVVITEEPVGGDAQLEFNENVTAILGMLTNEVKDLHACVKSLENEIDELRERLGVKIE